MGILDILPACSGAHVPDRSSKRGDACLFPERVSTLRDCRMFDLILRVEILLRSPVSLVIRIHAAEHIDSRWLTDLDVGINARGVGKRTGSFRIAIRFDADVDPDDVRFQILIATPRIEFAQFVPRDTECITLVSRGVVARTFSLTDPLP